MTPLTRRRQACFPRSPSISQNFRMRSRIVCLQSAFSHYPWRVWKEDQHTPRSCKIFQFFHLGKFIKNLILLEWSRKLRDDTKNGCMCSRLHFVPLKYFFGSFEKRHALRAFRRVWRARVNKNLAALGDRLQFKERD